MTTGERAFRLLWDIVSVASERLRDAAGPPPPPPARPATPTVPPKPAAPAAEAKPKAPAASKPKPTAKPKTKAKPKAKGSRKGKKRPDQMIRVLELLEASATGWLSAKELSDAGEAGGTPILPGNVRKVIRARGEGLVETRPRDGSRRGALEYRITDAGRAKLPK